MRTPGTSVIDFRRRNPNASSSPRAPVEHPCDEGISRGNRFPSRVYSPKPPIRNPFAGFELPHAATLSKKLADEECAERAELLAQ
jgi:hypothetical protein